MARNESQERSETVKYIVIPQTPPNQAGMQLSRDSLDLVLRSQGHKIPHIANLKLVEDWKSAD